MIEPNPHNVQVQPKPVAAPYPALAHIADRTDRIQLMPRSDPWWHRLLFGGTK